MDRQQLLRRIEKAWTTFTESYAGLLPSQMTDPLVTSTWSVKDIVAHVTWWEEEALKYLPLVAKGVRPPKYSAMYDGGLDGFNALMTEERRALSLAEVLSMSDEVHRRLLQYLDGVPQELFATETRFRARLRLDTYSHYPTHAEVIRTWRERSLL